MRLGGWRDGGSAAESVYWSCRRPRTPMTGDLQLPVSLAPEISNTLFWLPHTCTHMHRLTQRHTHTHINKNK